jgi:hypothetical protein
LFFYRSGQVVSEIRALEKTLMASTDRLDREVLSLRARMHDQEGLTATLQAYDAMNRMHLEWQRSHPEDAHER